HQARTHARCRPRRPRRPSRCRPAARPRRRGRPGDLQTLDGIGPWTAAHVWVRAAGTVDTLPLHQPRCPAPAARLDGRSGSLGRAALVARAEPWRPFRTWTMVLIRYALGPNPDAAMARRAPSCRLAELPVV